MLDVRLGVTPDIVAGYLRDCRRELDAVQQRRTPAEALAEYQRWSNQWARTMGTSVSPGDVTRLITSQRYWTLQSPLEGHGALREIIELEVAERTTALDLEITDLGAAIDGWAWMRPAAAIVLDTTVLLEYYDQLDEIDWNKETGAQSNVAVALTVPLAAIRELDNHKRSKTQAPKGGIAIRTQARQALRKLGEWVPDGDEVSRIRSATPGRSDIFVRLLLDPLHHSPIAETDSEIIDRAASLSPFVEQTYVATFDRAQYLSARRAGLRAVEFEYDE